MNKVKNSRRGLASTILRVESPKQYALDVSGQDLMIEVRRYFVGRANKNYCSGEGEKKEGIKDVSWFLASEGIVVLFFETGELERRMNLGVEIVL